MLVAMDARSAPSISSFVIRFVVESSAAADSPPPYRGFIRHIQTEEEMPFSAWEDAVQFIKRFVPLEADPGPGRA